MDNNFFRIAAETKKRREAAEKAAADARRGYALDEMGGSADKPTKGVGDEQRSPNAPLADRQADRRERDPLADRKAKEWGQRQKALMTAIGVKDPADVGPEGRLQALKDLHSTLAVASTYVPKEDIDAVLAAFGALPGYARSTFASAAMWVLVDQVVYCLLYGKKYSGLHAVEVRKASAAGKTVNPFAAEKLEEISRLRPLALRSLATLLLAVEAVNAPIRAQAEQFDEAPRGILKLRVEDAFTTCVVNKSLKRGDKLPSGEMAALLDAAFPAADIAGWPEVAEKAIAARDAAIAARKASNDKADAAFKAARRAEKIAAHEAEAKELADRKAKELADRKAHIAAAVAASAEAVARREAKEAAERKAKKAARAKAAQESAYLALKASIATLEAKAAYEAALAAYEAAQQLK